MIRRPPRERAQRADGTVSLPSGWTVGYVVGILAIGYVVAYLDRAIIAILIEPMRLQLGLTDTQLSLVQGFAFAMFFVLAGLPVGRLVDRVNRRDVLVFGLVCWSVATFACGLSHNFWQLFMARLATGVGEACLAPASFSMVADLTAPNKRGLPMGALVGGATVGSACSIFVGGLILQAFPHGAWIPLLGHAQAWQLVFFSVGSPGLGLALLLLLTVREPARRETVDGKSAASFLEFARLHPAACGFTFAAFAANLTSGIAATSWVPVILVRVYKVPAAQLGATIGLMLLTLGAAAPPIGGAMGDWLHRRLPALGRLGVPLVIFPILTAVSLAWLFVPGALATIIYFGVAVALLGSVINGASYPAVSLLVPNEMRGQAVTSFMLLGYFVGMGVAPTAVALITDKVFHDPMMVRQSVILVALPANVLGTIFSLLALGPYRRACQADANPSCGNDGQETAT